MTRDLPVRWSPFHAVARAVKLTRRDAAWQAALAGTVVLTLAGAWSAWRWRYLVVPIRAVLGALVLAGTASGLTWLRLPSTLVVDESILSGPSPWGWTSYLEGAGYQTEIALEHSGKEPTAENIRDGLRHELEAADRRPRPQEGDAPGDYQLLLQPNGGWELLWINQFGHALNIFKHEGSKS
jgi:hypothetical protein